MGDIVSTLKRPNKGLRQYDGDTSSNLNIGAGKYDILTNYYLGEDEPASGDGMDGTVIKEAYITTDGLDKTTLCAYLDEESAGDDVYAGDATSLKVDTGTIYAHTWLVAPRTGEKMWIDNYHAASGTLTVVRGQLGTHTGSVGTGDLLGTGYELHQIGHENSWGIYTIPFKVDSGYWSAIKCVSNDQVGQAINIQAKSLLPGDDLALDGTYTGSTGEFSSGDNFVGIYPGDIIYGKFKSVSVLKPSTGNYDVRLIRGV